MTTEKLRLVPMDRSHIDGIYALERQCFSQPYSPRMLEEALYEDTLSYLVAEDEEEAVQGYACLRCILDEGYIENIAVAPLYRRAGLARRLLQVFCDFAAAHLRLLTLEVRVSNEAAIGLYASMGFVEVGRRPRYYTEPREDALLMTRYFRGDDDEHTGH